MGNGAEMLGAMQRQWKSMEVGRGRRRGEGSVIEAEAPRLRHPPANSVDRRFELKT